MLKKRKVQTAVFSQDRVVCHFFNEFLPCEKCFFFCHAQLKENQSDASLLTLNKPPTLTRRKFPNVTFYPVEQASRSPKLWDLL